MERLLGEGSSARVWQARHRSQGLVALKHVHLRAVGALPEHDVQNAVDHPNLVRVRDVRVWRGDPVLVLDLAGGGTLGQLLTRRRRLTAGEVRAALTPVASAASAIHAAGLVHGDISPANVLFDANGLPMLGDLGSAYLADGVAPTVAARGFADPALEHRGVSGPASDVYGLAAVGFAAVTGRPPGEFAACADELAALAVPSALADVLLAGLDPDPARRGTALEFAVALRWSGPMAGVDLHAGRHSAAEPLPALTRNRRCDSGATGDAARSWSRRRGRPGRGSPDMPPRRPSR